MPGTVLNTKDTALNNRDKANPQEAYTQEEEDDKSNNI